jgi:hypothetical protein
LAAQRQHQRKFVAGSRFREVMQAIGSHIIAAIVVS